MRRVRIGLVLALLIAASCGGSAPTGPTPRSPAGWTTRLDTAFDLAGRQPQITSLVVTRDGAIVREQYWHGGGPDTPQDVRSVTKSVTSLLVGTALDRGCLRSLDQTVGEMLGPLGPPDSDKRAITVRHLLTMSSGLGSDELENVNEYNLWASAPNQLDYVWNLPILSPAGTHFVYNSGVYHVLSAILTRACGAPTADFARDTVFGPLGFGARSWETDNQGFANGAAGLMLTPRDMVAIGNLVLGEGRAAAGQVVSAGWVRDATRSHVDTSAQPYATGYGLGWWTGQMGTWNFAFANGYGGQFIVVVPGVRLVVTATNRWQGIGTAAAGSDWIAVMNIIMQNVLPAFQT